MQGTDRGKREIILPCGMIGDGDGDTWRPRQPQTCDVWDAVRSPPGDQSEIHWSGAATNTPRMQDHHQFARPLLRSSHLALARGFHTEHSAEGSKAAQARAAVGPCWGARGWPTPRPGQGS